MRKITITDEEENQYVVDLIRYFQYNNDLYLIYWRGESDSKDYRKLYLVKIYEELGIPVVQTLKNDKEWKSMQEIVKKALKEIKSGKYKLVKDIDFNSIDGIQINNPRFFKLEEKLAETLSKDYLANISVDDEDDTVTLENKKSTTNINDADAKNIQTDNYDNDKEIVNYEKLYLDTKAENENSSLIINDLISEVQKYKEKFGELE